MRYVLRISLTTLHLFFACLLAIFADHTTDPDPILEGMHCMPVVPY